MQDGAANSVGVAARKNRLGALIAAHKANAAEGLACFCGDADIEGTQGFEAIGQKAFAAGLVNGRDRAIGDGNCQPLAPRRDRCRQADWPSADDENVDPLLRTYKIHQEQNPRRFWG
jgi:hypothetical protein